MRTSTPRRAPIVALVAAILLATAPAVASAVVAFARNAGRVDGFSAVKATASLRDRSGKLVATSRTTGRLPNDIIAEAPNANRLDGLDSSAFVRNRGFVVVSVPWTGWRAGGGSASDFHVSTFAQETQVHKATAGSNQFAEVGPELPVAMYGRRLEVRSVQVCYDATDPNVTLDAFFLNAFDDTAGVGSPAVVSLVDATNRHDRACRRYTFATPVLMTPSRVIDIVLRIDFAGPGTMLIGRTTFVLRISGAAPAPPAGGPRTVLSPATGGGGGTAPTPP